MIRSSSIAVVKSYRYPVHWLLFVNEKKNIATDDNEILRICHNFIYATMLICNYHRAAERNLIHICKSR
jgi:hypothetical protein